MIPNLEVVATKQYLELYKQLDKAHKAYFPPHITKNFRRGCAIVAKKRIHKMLDGLKAKNIKITKRTLVLYWRKALVEAAKEAAFQVNFKDS